MLYHLNKISRINGLALQGNALFTLAHVFSPFEIPDDGPIFGKDDEIMGYFVIVRPTIQIKGHRTAVSNPECIMLHLAGSPAYYTVSAVSQTIAYKADPEKIEAALNKCRQLRILFRLLTTKEYLITL
ncbi:MAG: hypothetical protein ACO1N9_05795 [Flavobacterium sp.]